MVHGSKLRILSLSTAVSFINRVVGYVCDLIIIQYRCGQWYLISFGNRIFRPFHGQILPFCYICASKSVVDEMIQCTFSRKLWLLLLPFGKHFLLLTKFIGWQWKADEKCFTDSLPINHGMYLLFEHLFFSSLSEFSHLVEINLSCWPRYLGLCFQNASAAWKTTCD